MTGDEEAINNDGRLIHVRCEHTFNITLNEEKKNRRSEIPE
jgi:hypothetical protein